MAFKVNYQFERAERERAKLAKKAAKAEARKLEEAQGAGAPPQDVDQLPEDDEQTPA